MATAADIAAVRRMIGEMRPTSSISDAEIAAAIMRHPIVDALGRPPYLATAAPSGGPTPNPDWTPTYDLHHAAADLWADKAANIAEQSYDFRADGGSYTRSQIYEHCMAQVRWHMARRAVATVTQTPAWENASVERGQ